VRPLEGPALAGDIVEALGELIEERVEAMGF